MSVVEVLSLSYWIHHYGTSQALCSEFYEEVTECDLYASRKPFEILLDVPR